MKLIKAIEKLEAGEELKIAALGDSLTYGWLSKYGFLDFLQTLISKKYPDSAVKILNRGIPGDTARDGLRRTENDIIKSKPDVVFIQFGLNDAYTGISPEDFQKYIELIILKINENSYSEIALLTSVALLNPQENMYAEKYYLKITETGGKYKLPVVPVHKYWENRISSGIKHSLLVQSDGIHPNEKGYELMAEAVFELF